MIKFAKWHGFGNDYIVIDGREVAAIDDLSAWVQAACDRRTGIGGDGVAVVSASQTADFNLRIINPDGGEAAMSGNGSRCAAAWVIRERLVDKEAFRFETKAGIKGFQCHRDDRREAGGLYHFTAEIGKPRFAASEIPMNVADTEPIKDFELSLTGVGAVKVTALEMCNPNVCVLVDEVDDRFFKQGTLTAEWRATGSLIEHHKLFPLRTNVEFVKVINRDHISARVWERGAGATASSGTGASAAAVAAMINDLTNRQVTVSMPGGDIKVEWRASDDEVLLSGTAQFVFKGETVLSTGDKSFAD